MRLRKPIETISSHIITPHWYDPKNPGAPYEPAWDVLDVLAEQMNGLTLPIEILNEYSFEGSVTLSLEALNEEDLSAIKTNAPFAEYWMDSFVVRGRGVFHEPNKILEFARDTGRIVNRDVATRLATNIAVELVNKILVLMNIYLPGSSRCLHYYRKDKMFGQMSRACDSSFDGAAVIMIEAGLSPVPNMSFIELIEWSRQVDGFWEGKPTTNVGRAMTFFSHAHHQVRLVYTFADISWIVAALEALFTETSQEIRSKIIRRTMSLCPEIQKFTSRKEIGGLYDFRSRFLHGDIAIPNQFSENERGEWYGREFSNVFDVSSAILIRSLQKIAERGWTKLRFEEVVGE